MKVTQFLNRDFNETGFLFVTQGSIIFLDLSCFLRFGPVRGEMRGGEVGKVRRNEGGSRGSEAK